MTCAQGTLAHEMLSNRFLSSVGGTDQRLILLILNFRLPPVTFALWRHGVTLSTNRARTQPQELAQKYRANV